MNTVVLNLEPIAHLTDEQLYQLCIANRDLNLEMNAAGELIIMPPVGGESGNERTGEQSRGKKQESFHTQGVRFVPLVPPAPYQLLKALIIGNLIKIYICRSIFFISRIDFDCLL